MKQLSTKPITLSVSPDGEWEPDQSSPETITVKLSEKQIETLAKAQNFLNKNNLNAIELHMSDINFNLQYDGKEYDAVQMAGFASILLDKSGFYFRVATKHGYSYIFSETIQFQADDHINPAGSFSSEWDLPTIIQYDDEIFVTEASSRKILEHMSAINDMMGSVGFSELEHFLNKLQSIDQEYESAANELNINQFFEMRDQSGLDTTSSIFFEALHRPETKPENIVDMIAIAEQDLQACGEGYTIVEALDEAIQQIS